MVVVHLALSQKARQLQLAYLSALVREEPQIVLMGDFNCALNSPGLRSLLDQTGLQAPTANRHTFPSWRPRRSLDHILISPSLRAAKVDTLPVSFSDHLPLALTLML
jgi:endonuclease/exonuclease/phosphatase family metal-dependent hydrolase